MQFVKFNKEFFFFELTHTKKNAKPQVCTPILLHKYSVRNATQRKAAQKDIACSV